MGTGASATVGAGIYGSTGTSSDYFTGPGTAANVSVGEGLVAGVDAGAGGRASRSASLAARPDLTPIGGSGAVTDGTGLPFGDTPAAT